MYTWSDIVSDWEVMEKMSCKPKGMRRYRVDEVIDEEKSVRWNREEVERRNEAYAAEVKALNTAYNKAHNAVIEKALKYIIANVGYGCTRAKAQAIWNMAWSYGHANGLSDVYSYLTELMELATKLLSDD